MPVEVIFSVAVIERHNQGDSYYRVCLSYGSRMIRIYHGGEAEKQVAVMGAKKRCPLMQVPPMEEPRKTWLP